MTKEFAYYAASDMSKYSGSWVAIVNREVVASGPELKRVYAEAAEKSRGKEPLFAYIPAKEETLIL